jgi:hypothetical protein
MSWETIDRIEREASADKRFHGLFGGVWYYRARRTEGASGRSGAAESLVRSCWRSANVLHKRTPIRAQSVTMLALHHDWITC